MNTGSFEFVFVFLTRFIHQENTYQFCYALTNSYK